MLPVATLGGHVHNYRLIHAGAECSNPGVSPTRRRAASAPPLRSLSKDHITVYYLFGTGPEGNISPCNPVASGSKLENHYTKVYTARRRRHKIQFYEAIMHEAS